MRRKTYGTDDRYIAGARAPATQVLPHEASPLSGEPAGERPSLVAGERPALLAGERCTGTAET